MNHAVKLCAGPAVARVCRGLMVGVVCLCGCVRTNMGGMLEGAVVQSPNVVVPVPSRDGGGAVRLQVYRIDGCYYARVPVLYLPGREAFFHVADLKSHGYVPPSVTGEEAAARPPEYYYCRLSAYTAGVELQLPLSKQQEVGADIIPETELAGHTRRVEALPLFVGYAPESFSRLPERRGVLYYTLLPLNAVARVADLALGVPLSLISPLLEACGVEWQK